jgi:hypothetical protein
MSSSRIPLVITGAAGLLGGAVFVAYGLLGVFSSEYASGALRLAAWLCVLVALAGFYAGHRRSYGVLAKIGFFAALIGSALMLVGYFGMLVSPVAMGGWIPAPSASFLLSGMVYVIGVIIMGPGLLVVGVVVLRERRLPRWARYGFTACLGGAIVMVVLSAYLDPDVSMLSYEWDLDANDARLKLLQLADAIGQVADRT